jgi:IS5 family transposase
LADCHVRIPDAEQDRISVRRGAYDAVRTDGAAGAADILNDDILAEWLAHAFDKYAGNGVREAARRIRHDHGDRPVRITLRECAGSAEQRRERDSE